jgi:N-acetylmuramoyl-L-alanine amidase
MKIITRLEWGARARRGRPAQHTPKAIAIHHTSAPTARQFNGPSTIRGIQTYHMDHNGWDDIGYHYLIAPDGTIFAGRPENSIGAHVANHNTGNVGVCLIGDFEHGERVSVAQRAALVELLRNLCKIHGIKPAAIQGHRDHKGANTDCPGAGLHRELPLLRDEVSRAPAQR